MTNTDQHDWDRASLLAWLRGLSRRLRRLPGRKDVLAARGTPGIAVFYRRFGSLADAYRAAGLLKEAK
jgi:hypothetical protein